MKKRMISFLSAVLLLSVGACTAEKANSEGASEREMKQLTDLNMLSEKENYSVYELTFERDGLQIYGELYFPHTQEPCPIVVIGHGFGETLQSTADDAVSFAEEGIAAYVFDFCGGSPGSRSDGKTTEMSVLTERADMEAILDGIKDCAFADQSSVFLMGESQGGFAAALTAAKRAEDVRGLILFYPALVIPDDARELFSDRSQIPPETRLFGIRVGKKYYEDVLAMDAFQEIAGYAGDVLIVHGDRDSIVPVSYAESAEAEYNSAELVIIEGGGHGFYGQQLSTAHEAAVRYVREHTE